MKNILLFILVFVAFVSCDKIKTPNQRPPVVKGCIDPTLQVVNTNAGTFVDKRKVLIEDFTGHRCPNCPPAAVAAENIETAFPNQVVVIANHVTKNFAAPQSDLLYKEDFRDTTSSQWDDNTFKISNSGLPKGMVNRQSPFPKPYSSWSGLVSVILAQPQIAKLEMTSYYDPTSNYLTVNVKTSFKTAWPNSIFLMIVLTQDSIISDQEDNSPPANADLDPNDHIRRLNYKFDNIMIGSINDPYGSSGDMIKKGPVLAGDTVSKVSSCYLVKKCFFKKTSVCLDDKNVNVIAFVYDATTFEVLQVEKMKIRP